MRQTAGAWAWREQAGTRQRDATGSAEWLLFWDRLVEDVINLNAGQGWVALLGTCSWGCLARRGPVAALLHECFPHRTAVSGL